MWLQVSIFHVHSTDYRKSRFENGQHAFSLWKWTLLNMTCILHMKNQIQLTLIWSPDVDGDDDFDSESSQSRDMYVTTSLKLSTRWGDDASASFFLLAPGAGCHDVHHGRRPQKCSGFLNPQLENVWQSKQWTPLGKTFCCQKHLIGIEAACTTVHDAVNMFHSEAQSASTISCNTDSWTMS